MVSAKYLILILLVGSLTVAGCFFVPPTNTVKDPYFDPAPGEYSGMSIQVQMFSNTQNADIYYTKDGSTPDDTSTLYKGGPITVLSQTIKARAYLGTFLPSNVVTGVYTMTGGGDPGVDCTSTAPGICRDLTSIVVAKGENVPVVLKYNPDPAEANHYYIIEENVPSGWTIIDAGGATVDGLKLKWVKIQNAQATTFNYVIRAPNSAGTHTLFGEYGMEGLTANVAEISGDKQVTVQ